LFFDTFNASIPFAEEVAEANTTLVGTIIKSRKVMPKALQKAQIKRVNRCPTRRIMFLPCDEETRGTCGC
jgi:hypothetical protein